MAGTHRRIRRSDAIALAGRADRVLPGYLNKARNWLEAKYAEA